jgi:mannose-6-phosphate isomerase-like protein (cupin superfamily)
MKLHKVLSSAPWVKSAASNPGFVGNIEEQTIQNTDYRRVLFTTHQSQLVLMSLKPGEEIGEEIHDLDQFIRFEAGKGRITMNDFETDVSDGDAIVVPKGVKHNVVNTSDDVDLKLYAVYAPPNHQKDTIHKTKADEKEEHFDGEVDAS